MSNELSELKIGQVWQCRDQRYTVKVTSGTRIFRGRVYDSTRETGNEWNYSAEYRFRDNNGTTRYWVFNPPEECDQDLVFLIYDPDDT